VNRQRSRRISFWLMTVFFVLGCTSPFLAVTPPPQPAQSLDMLGTVIAQTANAAQTQTATFLPTSTRTDIPTTTLLATQTLAPTQTPLILVTLTPTATPGFLVVGTDGALVSVTPAAIVSPAPTFDGKPAKTEEVNGGAVIKTPKDWACKIVEKSPVKGSVIQSGLNFYAYWTVMNSGTQVWTNNGIDFIYLNGLRSESRVLQDLPNTIPPDSKITLRIPLTAPKNTGFYNVLWTLKVGNTYFCPMRVTFEVK